MNRPSVVLAAAGLALAACRGTEPVIGVPTSVAVTPSVVSLTAIGATLRLRAAVLDQGGVPIPNVPAQWASDDTAVVRVDGTGLVTAVGLGTTSVHASASPGAGPLVGSATVTVTQVARRFTKVSGDGQVDTIGSRLFSPVVVRVEDSLGTPIAGVVVDFAVTQGGGNVQPARDTTEAAGLASTSWSLGAVAGPNTVRASIGGTGVTGNPATFSATAVLAGTVPTVARFAGDAQVGLTGFAVNVPPAVQVRAASGAPIAGESVHFAVTAGGGALTGATALTDANGVARVGSWTITTGANALTATVQDPLPVIGNPVVFAATGATKAYHIDVRFLTAMTPAERSAFTNAATRWETVIFGDVPDVPVSLAAARCGAGTPGLNETIDDLVIFASIDSIDGPGKVLGQAGPCVVRSGSRLPLVGIMEFDSADVGGLVTAGQLDLVIAHEMGHVLGLGLTWGALLVGGGGTDPHFVGAQALTAFDVVGGVAYTAGAKVPVENCCGAGTRDAHWREAVFLNELMTGFLNAGSNPLSIVTVASMADLGYQVNLAGADPYVLTLPLVAAPQAAPLRALGNDVLRLPVVEIDAAGRIVRVIPPR